MVCNVQIGLCCKIEYYCSLFLLSRHTTRSYLLIFLSYVHTLHCFLIASGSFFCAIEAPSVSSCNTERLQWRKVLALWETIFRFPQLSSLIMSRFHWATSDWRTGNCCRSSFKSWMMIFSSQVDEIRKTRTHCLRFICLTWLSFWEPIVQIHHLIKNIFVHADSES